jgi:hypothetical protein
MPLYRLLIMSSVRLNAGGAVKQGRHFMIDASDMTPNCLSEQN